MSHVSISAGGTANILGVAQATATTAPHSTTASSDAGQIVDRAHGVVDPVLRAAVEGLSVSMRTLAGYHFGWSDEHGTPAITVVSSKAVRPALVLLATEAVGGDTTRGLPAAVAVELINNASLLHDDIIDHDTTRHHRPTLWAAFWIPVAILAGDALFFLATHTLSQAPAPLGTTGVTWLHEAVQQLIDGEYTDTTFEHTTEVTLTQRQTMAQNKTSALFGCACALGALAGGADPTQIERLRRFGKHLGIAFQYLDDLLGIWGDPTHTGKPHQSDLRTRKKTRPVVAALTSDSPAGAELGRLYQRPTPLADDELAAAAALVDSAGGRRWATRQAAHHLTTAPDPPPRRQPRPAAVADLTTLVHMIARTDH